MANPTLGDRILAVLAETPRDRWDARSLGKKLGVSTGAVAMAAQRLIANGKIDFHYGVRRYLYRHKAEPTRPAKRITP
jgi:DNA-binding MarR family transcriptional regulator